jgi:hypothetical protein
MEPHRTPHDVHERLLPRDTVGHIQGAVLAHTASVPTGLLEP